MKQLGAATAMWAIKAPKRCNIFLGYLLEKIYNRLI
jgi:hypothetical protein